MDLNNRKILNGLEIDILIPSIRLAIELNGPAHYFPIYGDKQLGKTINKDIIKQIETQRLGYRLFILDISTLKNKDRDDFLKKNFQEKIKPIIDLLLLETH